MWLDFHAWKAFWWYFIFFLLYQQFWLWIIDGIGIVEADWVWQIFTPLDANVDFKIVEDWVAVNTWTMAYTIEIIENYNGVPFDPTNDSHVFMLWIFTWPYLYEQLNLVNFFGT